MSYRERLDTVLAGGVPDRVPCIPLIYYFAASYGNIPYRTFTRSMKSYRRAMDRCFNDLGPWDAMYPLPVTMDAPEYEIVWGAGVGMRPSFPDGAGEITQTFQFTEQGALMEEGDYEKILAFPVLGKGYPYIKFLELLVARSAGRDEGVRFWASYLMPHIIRFGAKWVEELLRWRLKGIPFFPGFSLEAPFDIFSMARGLEEFAVDLYERGESLEAAVMKLSRAYARIARIVCELLGIRNFLLLVHRSSNHFISPTHYRRFTHPGIKHIADELARHGIVTGLHCDGNWDLNLEHMTDLPANTYFQLDGYTDIFRARRILGDRFTIMGDVHPNLLAFGGAAEVEAYCARLIREVGQEGRFILSSGCEVPPNAKPENVRVMIESARRYGRYD